MALLSTGYIVAMLGGGAVGAAKLAALGDTTAVNAWIARADSEVISAANRGGYSSVSSTSPTSGTAFEALVAISFDEFEVIANRYGREVDVGRAVGDASAKLYVDSPTSPRVNLPGIDRDTLGGSSGGEIANGSDLTTTSEPSEPRFTRTSLIGYA